MATSTPVFSERALELLGPSSVVPQGGLKFRTISTISYSSSSSASDDTINDLNDLNSRKCPLLCGFAPDLASEVFLRWQCLPGEYPFGTVLLDEAEAYIKSARHVYDATDQLASSMVKSYNLLLGYEKRISN